MFSHSKNIRMSTLIAIIVAYYLLIIIIIIITKSQNDYCSVRVMELCLPNLLILINCFCVILTLVCSLRACHMLIKQESHVYLWKIYLAHFLKFGNLQNSKFQKSELGKFIPNFPLKHVSTSTKLFLLEKLTN